MDGVDREIRRRRSLKERLGLTGIGCCGGAAAWGFRTTTPSVRDDEEQEVEEDRVVLVDHPQTSLDNSPNSPCDGQSPTVTGMNLAAALAAERQFRANEGTTTPSPSSTRSIGHPIIYNSVTTEGIAAAEDGAPRMSLMRLLEETGGYDEEEGENWAWFCCVCMGRKKGAAFIPCGHTFCRVCSKDLWLNRGSCPLCNRSIIEILHIY